MSNDELNNIINRLIEKMNSEIGKNTNYIEWLEKYTEKYPRFTDTEFLSKNKNKNAEDVERINMLNSLFDVIENYAQDNYIYITKDSSDSGHYKIQYNNIGYEIGYMIGQQTLFYCNRINNPDDSYINFQDIILNKKQPHTLEINKLIEELKIIINNYYERGIPIEALKRCIYESLKDINDNKEGKVLKNEYKRI